MSISEASVGTPQIIFSFLKGNIKSNSPPLPRAIFRKNKNPITTARVMPTFKRNEYALKNLKKRYINAQGNHSSPVGLVKLINRRNRST
jgi:hypothetical protein